MQIAPYAWPWRRCIRRVGIQTSQSLFLPFIPSDKSSRPSCNRYEKSPSIAHSPSEEKSTCLGSTCSNRLTRFCNTGRRTQSRDRRTQSRGSRALHTPQHYTFIILQMNRAIEIRRQCTHFRILVIGRANAGKTTLLKKVCETTDEPRIYDPNGKEVGFSIYVIDIGQISLFLFHRLTHQLWHLLSRCVLHLSYNVS